MAAAGPSAGGSGAAGGSTGATPVRRLQRLRQCHTCPRRESLRGRRAALLRLSAAGRGLHRGQESCRRQPPLHHLQEGRAGAAGSSLPCFAARLDEGRRRGRVDRNLGAGGLRPHDGVAPEAASTQDEGTLDRWGGHPAGVTWADVFRWQATHPPDEHCPAAAAARPGAASSSGQRRERSVSPTQELTTATSPRHIPPGLSQLLLSWEARRPPRLRRGLASSPVLPMGVSHLGALRHQTHRHQCRPSWPHQAWRASASGACWSLLGPPRCQTPGLPGTGFVAAAGPAWTVESRTPAGGGASSELPVPLGLGPAWHPPASRLGPGVSLSPQLVPPGPGWLDTLD